MVDLAVQRDRSSGPAPDFERTPPQDIAAEQSVLGGMLLSKDAIADVVEVVRSTDFYRPAHQTIFDVIVDLYGKGEPADAVTVSAELTRSGEISRVGGAPYLHTLLSSVPTAANAGYYARIVTEQAILRRLVEAGTRIVQLGYATGLGDVDDVVDRAQQAVYDVTEKRTSEDYALLEDLMQPTMDELEAIGSRGGSMTGVPTGFADLDQLTNGLHPGQLVIIAARPGLGKALALDTPLPTPNGWTTMGAVAVGDQLLGADGRPTTVVAATDVMVGRPCFEVTFSDGARVIADAEHQWFTRTRAERRAAGGSNGSVKTTAELAATVRCATTDSRANHAVPVTAPLDLPDAELLIAPYVLGVWLGHGESTSAHVVVADAEQLVWIEAAGVAALPTSSPIVFELDLPTSQLRDLGVLDDKHLPAAYLRGSEAQRREVLAGLLDAYGTVGPDGAVHVVTSARLAEDVAELVAGLGYAGEVSPGSTTSTVSFSTADSVFRLSFKDLAHKEFSREAPRAESRDVVDVRPVPSVPVRCVQVDNTDHLYLATRSMIPTHNSTMGLDVARSCSVKNGMASVIFSLEMTKTEITMRLLSAEARVPLHHMRAGTMTDDDWARLARRMGEVADAPLFIDDSPNLTMMEIRAKARRLKQRHNLKLVVVDYLQLMQGNKKAESRQQEVSELSRSLKLLAKELDCPVIAMSQLNRGPEQRQDKKPMLSDLRESGCLPASTRILRADTGAETTMGELYASGARDVPVWSLDNSLRYVRRHLTHVFATGTREVFRLRLASGKTVRATANHPFLTYDGWKPLGELQPGARLAVPRHLPAPEHETAWSDGEVRLAAVRLAARGDVSAEASALPKRQLRLLLRELYALAAASDVDGQAYVLPHRTAADHVSRLLLRFGISSDVCSAGQLTTVAVAPGDDRVRFAGQIESGLDGDAARDAVLAALRGDVGAAVSDPLWTRLQSAMSSRAADATARLSGVATALLDDGLELEAVNDVFWDAVVEITPDGVEEVFDATVVGNHNFVADGIAVHNSIEQDADMVVLLHREDAYEKESPRAGEADFIVAKHRNGPTATITVAFQGHYSRFVDMSPS
ncbi:MAG: replicative DNA helicase [Frankiaceae bacterium]|nr:replicative DNA helicase [Frankiaceae bacterium]